MFRQIYVFAIKILYWIGVSSSYENIKCRLCPIGRSGSHQAGPFWTNLLFGILSWTKIKGGQNWTTLCNLIPVLEQPNRAFASLFPHHLIAATAQDEVGSESKVSVELKCCFGDRTNNIGKKMSEKRHAITAISYSGLGLQA